MPAYYDEEEGIVAETQGRQRPKSNLPALAGVAAVVVMVGGGAWYLMGNAEQAPGEIPVIVASDVPMKTAPENAGGEQTPHTDMAAFDADDDATGETTLGAEATRPADEDLPRAALTAADTTPTRDVTRGASEELDRVSADAVPDSTALTYVQPARPASAEEEDGIDIVALDDGQIFMPQGLSQPRMPRLITSEAELLNTPRPVELRSTQAEPVPARGEGSELAPPVSPIVRLRSPELATRFAEASADDAAAEQMAELVRAAEQSPVQIQLGAYPERNKIEAEWSRLQGENNDILSGRALAVQQTISGGITYYRLRVGPFRSPQEASTVCQALKARGYDCLLAINTESRG